MLVLCVSVCVNYIYIYAFSRRFYPKRLTLHSSYSFCILSALAFSGNRTHDLGFASAMLYRKVVSNIKAKQQHLQFGNMLMKMCFIFNICTRLIHNKWKWIKKLSVQYGFSQWILITPDVGSPLFFKWTLPYLPNLSPKPQPALQGMFHHCSPGEICPVVSLVEMLLWLDQQDRKETQLQHNKRLLAFWEIKIVEPQKVQKLNNQNCLIFPYIDWIGHTFHLQADFNFSLLDFIRNAKSAKPKLQKYKYIYY